MVLPFMTLYLTSKDVGRTLAEAGVVMGLFGLGSIIGAYFGGKFTDRIGFFKVQMVALIFGGILFMVLGQLKNYHLICLCTFLLSFVNEAFRPANSSAIAFYSRPENRTRSYSLNRLAINLGWAVGASLGGLIAAINYELLFWVDGCTNLTAAVLLFVFLKPARIIPASEEKHVEEAVPVNQSAYRDKTYMLFIFLSTLFGLCFFQMFTTIPKYFRDNLFLGEDYIGFIMAVNGILIVVVEMVLVYVLEQKNKTVFLISLGTFICALSFFSLLLPGNAKWITLFMILLITIGEMTAMPFMNTYWAARSNEKNRGQYAALYSMSWGIGQALGPFLCSKLVDATDFQTLFIVLGCVLLAVTFGFSRLANKP